MTPTRRSQHERDKRLMARIEQLDALLQLRATLIATIDCDDRYTMARECRKYLADHADAMRLSRQFSRMDQDEEHEIAI